MTATARRFDAMIGTGGIGSGIVLALEGNGTLGREESRTARLLDRRDYAKLHIICHYVRRLLGDGFAVLPIGAVGRDAAGTALRRQMRSVGLDLRHVRSSATASTLFAVGYVYPDGEGGNITSLAASDTVTVEQVGRAVPAMRRHAARAIALAVPEAPVPARLRLLDAAGEHGLFRVVSLLSGEIRDGRLNEFLPRCDLIALNADEAAAVLGRDGPEGDPLAVARAAVARLRADNPSVQVIVTAGRHGSVSADAHGVRHAPALPVPPVSTAGAGDAHLAGALAGLAAGADLHAANQLAAVVSALKVTSPHAINEQIDPAGVLRVARAWGVTVDPLATALLDDVARRRP